MTKIFSGRRALITGSSYGIGAATAERLAAEGADVVLTGRTLHRQDRGRYNPVSLDETAERLRTHGGRVEVIGADLGDPAQRDGLVARAATALGGPIDILVNNAAAGIYKPTSSYPLDKQRLMFEVNVHAPVDLAQQAIPAMSEGGEGWIVHVSSGVANHARSLRVEPPTTNAFGTIQAVYGATKAALDRLTVTWAQELYDTGIRMNAVAPSGAVMSEGAVARGMDMVPEDAVQSMEAMVESIRYLCQCPPDQTGGVVSCIPLLEELGIDVLSLDGTAPHPGGFRRA